MKNVLLIGDSIRLGYEERVRELLGPNVTVYTPGENNRFAKYALWGIWDWMEKFGMPKIHVAQFNAGIWDMHRCTRDGKLFTGLDDYAKDIRRLAAELQVYSEKVMFATTIPGGRGLDRRAQNNVLVEPLNGFTKIFLPAATDEWNAGVCAYNQRAVEEMADMEIPVNDFYSEVILDTDLYIGEDGIHPTEDGYELLAQLTAKKIEAML